MAKQLKHLQKDMKKLSKQLNSDKGLMLKKNYDCTLSFYGKGKENKPYVTVNSKGDFKISVIKLIVIITCVLSTLALLSLLVRSISEHCRPKPKKHFLQDEFPETDEDWL